MLLYHAVKKIVFIVIILILFGCKSHDKISCITTTQYVAEENNGVWSKGEVIDKYSVGYYKNGSQKYFVRLIGFTKNDTIFYEPSSAKSNKKGRFEYFYDDKNEVTLVAEIRGDTTFSYSPHDLKEPNYISIVKNKRIDETLEYSHKKTKILEWNNYRDNYTLRRVRIDYLNQDVTPETKEMANLMYKYLLFNFIEEEIERY